MDYSGEIEFPIEFEFKVKYRFYPTEPMTMEYPGCPAEIEILDISIGDKEVSGDLFDLIMKDHEDEIKEQCGEHHDANKNEQLITIHSRPIRRNR